MMTAIIMMMIIIAQATIITDIIDRHIQIGISITIISLTIIPLIIILIIVDPIIRIITKMIPDIITRIITTETISSIIPITGGPVLIAKSMLHNNALFFNENRAG